MKIVACYTLLALAAMNSFAATSDVTTGAAALVNPDQPEFLVSDAHTTATVQATRGPRTITADLENIRGALNTYFKRCVGADHPIVGLRADFQRDLEVARRECGFEYLRCHGVLSDDMGVYVKDRSGKLDYNWMYVDSFYDFLQSIRIKPFVELSFMPQALTDGTTTTFFWKGIVTPPRDFAKWGDLISAFTKHLTERYGADEVRSWYFEVWNEPNIGFWRGTQAEYFQLYDSAARAIAAVDPSYRVGGPATAGPRWISELLAFCKEKNAPVQFVSTHSYATHSRNKVFDLAGTITDQVREARDAITTSPYPKLELHLTEWGPSPSFRDVRHDSYRCPAFILEKVKECEGITDSLSYWAVSDIFEEGGPATSPFYGGFGLLNFQGLRKPAFFAYKYLNQLGPSELQNSDKQSYVCKDAHGNVQALFWDYSPAHDGDKGPVVWHRNDPPQPVGDVTLNLAHLTPGDYVLSVHQVGYRNNDVFSGYKDLQSPLNLTRDQVSKLQNLSKDEPVEQKEIVINGNGTLSHTVKLRQNDCVLVRLDRNLRKRMLAPEHQAGMRPK